MFIYFLRVSDTVATVPKFQKLETNNNHGKYPVKQDTVSSSDDRVNEHVSLKDLYHPNIKTLYTLYTYLV